MPKKIAATISVFTPPKGWLKGGVYFLNIPALLFFQILTSLAMELAGGHSQLVSPGLTPPHRFSKDQTGRRYVVPAAWHNPSHVLLALVTADSLKERKMEGMRIVWRFEKCLMADAAEPNSVVLAGADSPADRYAWSRPHSPFSYQELYHFTKLLLEDVLEFQDRCTCTIRYELADQIDKPSLGKVTLDALGNTVDVGARRLHIQKFKCGGPPVFGPTDEILAKAESEIRSLAVKLPPLCLTAPDAEPRSSFSTNIYDLGVVMETTVFLETDNYVEKSTLVSGIKEEDLHLDRIEDWAFGHIYQACQQIVTNVLRLCDDVQITASDKNTEVVALDILSHPFDEALCQMEVAIKRARRFMALHIAQLRVAMAELDFVNHSMALGRVYDVLEDKQESNNTSPPTKKARYEGGEESADSNGEDDLKPAALWQPNQDE